MRRSLRAGTHVAVRRRGRRARWPRRSASRRSSRGCCASAGSAIPRRRRASSTRRSITCTIRCCWPTCASPSIASWRAIARKERIAIHGDYDVDGITSTVILRRALELLGADVVHFIPERLRDGYGLQPAAIERLHADGVRADRLGGLRHPRRRGGAARARARRRPDHHRPPRARRRAAAGARGHQPEAARLHLSGQEPRRRRRGAEAGAGALPARPAASSWLPGFVKIAAIGTLADVVPLVGENRVIAKLGLELLSQGPAQGRPARAARRLRA